MEEFKSQFRVNFIWNTILNVIETVLFVLGYNLL